MPNPNQMMCNVKFFNLIFATLSSNGSSTSVTNCNIWYFVSLVYSQQRKCVLYKIQVYSLMCLFYRDSNLENRNFGLFLRKLDIHMMMSHI